MSVEIKPVIALFHTAIVSNHPYGEHGYGSLCFNIVKQARAENIPKQSLHTGRTVIVK